MSRGGTDAYNGFEGTAPGQSDATSGSVGAPARPVVDWFASVAGGIDWPKTDGSTAAETAPPVAPPAMEQAPPPHLFLRPPGLSWEESSHASSDVMSVTDQIGKRSDDSAKPSSDGTAVKAVAAVNASPPPDLEGSDDGSSEASSDASSSVTGQRRERSEIIQPRGWVDTSRRHLIPTPPQNGKVERFGAAELHIAPPPDLLVSTGSYIASTPPPLPPGAPPPPPHHSGLVTTATTAAADTVPLQYVLGNDNEERNELPLPTMVATGGDRSATPHGTGRYIVSTPPPLPPSAPPPPPPLHSGLDMTFERAAETVPLYHVLESDGHVLRNDDATSDASSDVSIVTGKIGTRNELPLPKMAATVETHSARTPFVGEGENITAAANTSAPESLVGSNPSSVICEEGDSNERIKATRTTGESQLSSPPPWQQMEHKNRSGIYGEQAAPLPLHDDGRANTVPADAETIPPPDLLGSDLLSSDDGSIDASSDVSSVTDQIGITRSYSVTPPDDGEAENIAPVTAVAVAALVAEPQLMIPAEYQHNDSFYEKETFSFSEDEGGTLHNERQFSVTNSDSIYTPPKTDCDEVLSHETAPDPKLGLPSGREESEIDDPPAADPLEFLDEYLSEKTLHELNTGKQEASLESPNAAFSDAPSVASNISTATSLNHLFYEACLRGVGSVKRFMKSEHSRTNFRRQSTAIRTREGKHQAGMVEGRLVATALSTGASSASTMLRSDFLRHKPSKASNPKKCNWKLLCGMFSIFIFVLLVSLGGSKMSRSKEVVPTSPGPTPIPSSIFATIPSPRPTHSNPHPNEARCALDNERATDCGSSNKNNPRTCCPGHRCKANTKFCEIDPNWEPGGVLSQRPTKTPTRTPITSDPTKSPTRAIDSIPPTESAINAARCALDNERATDCGSSNKNNPRTCCPGHRCKANTKLCEIDPNWEPGGIPSRRPTKTPTRTPTRTPITSDPTKAPTRAIDSIPPTVSAPYVAPIEESVPPTAFEIISSHLKRVVPQPDILNDIFSPQFKAMSWLASDMDPNNPYDEVIIEQRFSLVTIWYASGGVRWTEDGSAEWLSSQSECMWSGVSCSLGSVITSLDLSHRNVRGPIPPEVMLLSELKIFSASGNSISSIPRQIGNLKKLKRLYLDKNAIKGTIPKQLGKLGRVTDLSLNDNLLQGPIPKEMEDMGALRLLHLEGNNITGEVPEGVCALRYIGDDFTRLASLTVDCGARGRNTPKVVCDCCTKCYPDIYAVRGDR